ncbi:MAG: DUF805 domain-containing protein [Alphaproteobacteria bacterium]|nr:DUF805 domain-containing protein [Alphaproteobacteria bacterium]MBV9863173.1 DUF805 domain-containing protein [Alphaproteobacteria bacterium]
MKGNIIGFDPDTNTGAISGHDGKRYDFATVDWHGSRRPVHGAIVDFTPDNAHASQIYPVDPEYIPPSFTEFYFSPRGRISRSQYWLRWALPLMVIYSILWVLIIGTKGSSASNVFSAIYGIMVLVTFWPGIAIIIKRGHDRDWPWPFMLVMLVPFVQFWPLVEYWFLRGTIGANRFGADPVPRR